MAGQIEKVADRAGVSIATVSRVFTENGYVSEETKKRVQEAAKQIGYSPPRHGARRSRSTIYNAVIGVVVCDLYNPFFTQIIRGITHVLEPEGVEVLICDADESPRKEIRCLDMLRQKKVDGIIISPTSDTEEFNIEYLKNLDQEGMPMVFVDRDLKGVGLDGVFLDSFNGAMEALQALIDCGHKNIATIAGPITSKPGLDRLSSYMEVMKRNHLSIRQEYILYGDFKIDSAYTLTMTLLERHPEVTAIFAGNNFMALGAMKAIAQRGLRIPLDISLISFGSVYLAEGYDYGISEVRQPTFSMGVECANILLEKMKNASLPRKERRTVKKRITLDTELVLRGSEIYPANKMNA